MASAQVTPVVASAQVTPVAPITPASPAPATVAERLFSPAQREAYEKLGKAKKERFDSLFGAVGGLDAEPDSYSRKAAEGLGLMLENKALTKGDPPVLSILAKRVGQPLTSVLAGKGLSADRQMQNIVNTLAYPDSVVQGEGSNTCVVASLETVMAKDYPRNYAKVVTGLLWDGTARKGGRDINLSTAELGKDGTGRTSTSELLQGSLREFAHQFPPDGEDYEGGRYGAKGSYGRGRYGAASSYGAGKYGAGDPGDPGRTIDAAQPVPGGVTQYQAEKLYERVLGKPAVNKEVTEENRDSIWRNIEKRLTRGKSVPAGVAASDAAGNEVLHQITLLKIEGGKVWVADSGRGQATDYPISQIKGDLLAVVLPGSYQNYDFDDLAIERNAQNPGDADRRYLFPGGLGATPGN